MGWESYGVDIDKDMVEYGKRVFSANLFSGSFDKAVFSDKYFDVITMFNLLDHLRQPLMFLKEVERILKPGGIIYINVHDAAGWKAKRYGENWGAYCPPGHLYYYSHNTLKALLDKAGLRFYIVPGVNLKEGIKMLAIKNDDPRQRSDMRGIFEKFTFNTVRRLNYRYFVK
jgi:ubiquinone/menaquinone biosynthesis C-methylase UbiE